MGPCRLSGPLLLLLSVVLQALSTRTGPRQPRPSQSPCDFYYCPYTVENTPLDNSLGQENGDGSPVLLYECEYGANYNLGCSYDPTTGQYLSGTSASACGTGVCVPHDDCSAGEWTLCPDPPPGYTSDSSNPQITGVDMTCLYFDSGDELVICFYQTTDGEVTQTQSAGSRSDAIACGARAMCQPSRGRRRRGLQVADSHARHARHRGGVEMEDANLPW